MSVIIKKILKDFTPPIILYWYKRLSNNKYGFFGNYESWSEAQKETTGYDSQIILDKVKESLLKVRDGKAVFERDSVLFDIAQYSFPLLSGLLYAACWNNCKLSVMDFGGSLGSTYFQCRRFLENIKNFKWSIIEQESFVKCGKEYFETEQLKFYYTIDECLKKENPDLLLLSSVIQYLENPYEFLAEILELKFKFIVIDRTMFFESLYEKDRITVQKVPPNIYKASYPAWFFNLNRFLSLFKKDYELITDFKCLDQHKLTDAATVGMGFIFKRNN